MRKYKREWSARHRPAILQQKRVSHTCYDCNKPTEPQRSRCKLHLRRGTATTKRYGQTPKGKANRRYLNNRASRRRRRTCRRFEYVQAMKIRKGKKWTIMKEQYYNLIKNVCHYCGLNNNTEAGAGLDRLDNNLGYELDNVVSCCIECNRVRSDLFSVSEMKTIGKVVRQIKLARSHER